MPKIVIQTLTGKQHQLQVASSIQVKALKEQIQKLLRTETNQTRLVHKGESLNEQNDDQIIKFEDGDVILSFPVRKAPSSQIQKSMLGIGQDDDDNDDDDDDLKFKLDKNAPIILKKFVEFLKQKLKIPDFVLVAIFGMNKWVYICLTLFVLGGPIAHKYDLGPIYVIGWILLIIFRNLGKRKPGEMSAYSVFNEGFRELPGQFNAQQVDDQVRRGRM
eukprot:TRINITY_DN2609_c0_g1_i4.p4 TRINITY_DN2609_c0_g1~~TRINITY_DN2609_c0_g1_i4.p4  ORF type:complete len:218 (+),score=25.28 TRINITY_DN2609_c0_g1_i4:112-765(+)